MKLQILGNSGSGKTTLAASVAAELGCGVLSMDGIAWEPGQVRRDPSSSVRDLHEFIEGKGSWVMEGCYADLAEALNSECDTLWFLNPGIDACLANCTSRPFEADKFASAEEQEAFLAPLLDWVRRYSDREDEYGLARQQEVFRGFGGTKVEFTSLEQYADRSWLRWI